MAALNGAAQAVEDRGRLVIVEGPAGVGKSALLNAFLGDVDGPVLFGACDNMTIAPILGPFEDIARDVPHLDEAFRAGAAPFRRTLLDALTREHFVLAIEDLHWADQASLDLLTFISRRLVDVPALVIGTTRVEVARDHPVTRLLTSAPELMTRVRLSELSQDAVRTLASDTIHDPRHLYELTGGNPFLVTEFVEGDGSLPPTVADSVDARLAALPTRAGEVAAMLAVVRGEVEWNLVDALFPDGADPLADLEVAGIVVSTPDGISFRHELIRQALDGRLTDGERRRHNRTVLEAMVEDGAAPSRIAHHAWEAGDIGTLLSHGRAAVDEALASGSHTQGLEHLRRLLPLGDRLAPTEHADLLSTAAVELWRNDELTEAQAAISNAIEMWKRLGETESLGVALGRAATLAWDSGEQDEFVRLRDRGIALLDSIPPTPARARAYIGYAQDLSLNSRLPEAIGWLDRALALAEDHGWHDVTARALGAREPIRVMLGHGEAARSDGDHAIAFYQEHDAYADLSVTCTNRIAAGLNALHLDHIDGDVAAAVDYGRTMDLRRFETALAMHTARLHLLRGHWDQARQIAEGALDRVPAGVDRATALLVKAAVAGRRGDDTARRHLEEAVDLVWQTGDIQRIRGVSSLAAEFVWLGIMDDEGLVHRGYDLAQDSGFLRGYSELAIWLRRLGRDGPHHGPAPDPHRRELAGDHRGAADAWLSMKAPYQRALSMAFSGERSLMRESIDVLDDLGATAARDRVKQMMRDRGFTVGRRPAASTRANPAGLTSRQMEVLHLLAEDRTNQEIADRLFISPKTVEHHVSTILTKLGVNARRAAAARLPDLG